MSALKRRVPWVFGVIPVLLLAALLYVVSAASVASAADPSHFARKIRNGYANMGSVEALYSASVLAALGQEGIRCVCTRPVHGRVHILVPEEASEETVRVLQVHGQSWHFSSK